MQAGDLDGAREAFAACLALITGLRSIAANDGQLLRDEAWLRQRLPR